LITALGALLRFVDIGHQGFWYDEAYTSFLLRYSPGHMLGLLPSLESTPPLYYCVAWVWVRIFGNDPAGLKSLSALCGTATIPVVYLAGRKLLANWRSAVIGTALVAFNPLLIWYSQEARAYSMLVLMSALTLLTFAYARERPRAPAVGAWALACILALTTHYYAVLVVAPEAAWLLFEHRGRRAIRLALAAIVLTGLALVPLLIAQTGTGNDDWIEKTSILTRLAQVIPLLLLGPETHLRMLVKYLAYAAALVGLGAFLWRSRRRERQGGLLPGGIALIGFLIATTVGEATLLTRNLLPIMIPLALFLAAGLGASRARLSGIAATLVLCGVGTFAAVSVATDYSFERPNWQPLAQALGPWPHSKSGDQDSRILVMQDNPGLLPLGLYMDGLHYLKTETASRVIEIDLIAIRSKGAVGSFCWWGSACNLVPARLDRRFRPAGFRVARIYTVEQFHVLQLVASTPVTVRRSTLPILGKRTVTRFIRSGRGKLGDGYLIQRP
jgi:uncharacterized membrane protein